MTSARHGTADAGDARLRVNRPDVLDEVFDGEAVIVNLASGFYFALDAAGTEIWELLAGGRSAGRAAELLAERHGSTAEEAAALVLPFAGRLRDEQLLVPARADELEADPPAPPPRGAGPLAVPELQRFEDMQDLLLMDPVHDIDLDGDGWPMRGGERVAEARESGA